MTYEEYANTRLEGGGMGCRLPHQLTIRGWAEDWASNQFDDDREPKDASQITGTATLIHSSYHEGGWARFDGIVRCGDYIYIPDWERIPEYDWWYYVDHQDIADDSAYYNHIIEYCISTGETIDINLGQGATGAGNWSQVCVIEERKILYYEYQLDHPLSPAGHYIRIVDFSNQTIEKVLWIEEDVTPDFWRSIQDITVIRDRNDQIHLLVICIFGDDSKKYAGPDGENILGAIGFTIYHKNYTVDSQWQIFDVAIDSQDTNIGAWDRDFDIIDNRYLVVYGFRDTPGSVYGPIYLIHVVFDVITSAHPITYELQSPWGETWWDSTIVMFSSPDFTNGKLYEAISQYPGEDDIVDMSFNPITGEFVQGTISFTYPPSWRLYPMTTREHVYFWNEEDENFYLASTGDILGNYLLEYEANVTTPHHGDQGVNISFLLDSNGGENPLVWYWSYSGSSLKAIDIITGSVVFNMIPVGFSPLDGYTIHVLHIGDSLVLATENEVLYPHGDPPTTWNRDCTQVDYYLVT